MKHETGGINVDAGRVINHEYSRWPANIITDSSDQVESVFPDSKSGKYFYCAKTSKVDREEGCDILEERWTGKWSGGGGIGESRREKGQEKGRNTHPTVKPTSLMAYLCKVFTPTNGTILDPFMGSGSTGKGAVREGFNFIGIDNIAEYVTIAKLRIDYEIQKGDVEYEQFCEIPQGELNESPEKAGDTGSQP